MNCEMCGAQGRLFKTSIEGTELNVCSNCGKHGKVISEVRVAVREKKKKVQEVREETSVMKEVVQMIVSDFGKKIRDAREAKGLKQEEFAKMINEKESVVHNVEGGKFEPSISLARKLEGFLKVKLIEQYEDDGEKAPTVKSDSFTIGDFIKIKKK